MKRSVISSSYVDREIWQERDGRWLGTEFVIEEWYTPFSGNYENLPTTRRDTQTAAFPTKEAAQAWISEFDNARAVELVRQSGGTKLVIAW